MGGICYMERKMTPQELIGCFDEALEKGYILVYYQPQINHSTGRMVGAEALMRFKHPEFGIQYPNDFIPVMEENGLILRADLNVFEQVCKFQKKCIDSGVAPVPVSTNMSRYDILDDTYVDKLEEIRKKYDLPVKFLRVEITESSAIAGMELMTNAIDKLHKYGYIVEMDDFGSGYSSLNVLKDLEVDIIKLDMRFLSGDVGGRGGTIISSVVQMSKWLQTPVIAEGVETNAQADYMKSIGCNYIQGYLYSKPVPEDEFVEKLKKLDHQPETPATKFVDTQDAGRFWDPESIETLIFSEFVGPASIFTYTNGHANILRVNQKYAKEVCGGAKIQDILNTNPWDHMSETGRLEYETAIKKAIETGEEVECDSWRDIHSDCCGDDRICVRTNMRVIGKAGEQYLFYVMARNVTAEKKRFDDFRSADQLLRVAFDHANMFAWEYIFATKEMHPCFRCMRELSLPPVVRNYPEPVFENGLFPMDYHDMYIDWLNELANGAPSKEGIIPLTAGRVPFHVRYTTEYDENGKPLKAYGSATLVVE